MLAFVIHKTDKSLFYSNYNALVLNMLQHANSYTTRRTSSEMAGRTDNLFYLQVFRKCASVDVGVEAVKQHCSDSDTCFIVFRMLSITGDYNTTVMRHLLRLLYDLIVLNSRSLFSSTN